MMDKKTKLEVSRRIEEARRTGSLDLSRLQLIVVPDSIADLTNLRSLDLAGNNLHKLPSFLGNLQSLGSLNLSNNPFIDLPDSLSSLNKLHGLYLHHTPNIILPDWIGGFKSLQILAITDAGLGAVPAFVRFLVQLFRLDLDNNRITMLPNWLSDLSRLETLLLAGNRITELPEYLRTLPLTGLDVQNNTDLRIPAEIASSTDAKKVLDYYFRTRLDPEARPLNEFKLVLLGRGMVGKTTLVNKLVSDEYEEFKRTPGISITKWPNTIDGEEVRAHIWDFGGQEIMHGTHRFFMTERALYLILISGREGTEDRDAEYWLSMVRSFAGDVPVIVLLHKWTDYGFELNRELLRDKYGKDLVFLETDSESGEGIATLRERICALAKKLPGLKASWPSVWRKIKDELPEKKDSWITFDDFRTYCAENGVLKASDQEALAESLHDLGLMLSYRNDEALRHFGVLNPQWVTTGIYQVLNAPALRDVGGQFTLGSFRQILPRKGYPAELHPYLLALMRKFQLCHPLDDKGIEYLIPELLTKQEPKLENEFPPDECLGFIYKYDAVLPEGLLPRLIVATYVHRKPGLVWRSGVVLERGNCRALVRGDILGREVTVRVNGVGSRRELLGIIREHFERIHRTYEMLPVTEIVPVPKHPATHVKHELLLKYERDGREEIAVEVGDGLLDVRVKDLLDGVDIPGKRRLSVAWDRQGRDAAMALFVSYSRKDGALLDQLRAALVPYERVGKLRIWADMLTEAGEKWEDQIIGHLDSAEIVILLLSNDFLASAYCMEVELPRVLDRQAKGECVIVPIEVRACRYDLLPIGEIQAIRPGGRPIEEHENRDRAWLEVTKELDRVLASRKKAR